MQAESGGKVSQQAVVIVGGTEKRTVKSESATKDREPTNVRLRSFVCFHTKTVVLLREFGFLSSSLRLVILVEDLPAFAGSLLPRFRVCVSIKLRTTAQSVPAILVILCHSHRSSQGGINDIYYGNL